jgi:succinate dehydrogenase / fumarate reductase cytochrome b subunit
MTDTSRSPSLQGIARWFDPRGRKVGTWAFILNRVTAIGLTVYLYLHLVVLGKLAQGPEAYDSFVAMAKTPVYITGEFLVVAAGIIHGLNGIRVTLNSFGIAIPYQKQLFYGLMAIALIGIAIFGVRMYTA